MSEKRKSNILIPIILFILAFVSKSQQITTLSLLDHQDVHLDPTNPETLYYKLSVPSDSTPCDLTMYFKLTPSASLQIYVDFSNRWLYNKHPSNTEHKAFYSATQNLTMPMANPVDIYFFINPSQETSGSVYFTVDTPSKTFAISYIVFISIAVVFVLIIARIVVKSLCGIFPCIPRTFKAISKKICCKKCIKFFESPRRHREILNPPVVQASNQDDIRVSEILQTMEIQQKSLKERMDLEAVKLEIKSEPKSSDLDSLCIICLTEKKSVKYLPCEHICACFECSKLIIKTKRSCPLCRNLIDLVELE